MRESHCTKKSRRWCPGRRGKKAKKAAVLRRRFEGCSKEVRRGIEAARQQHAGTEPCARLRVAAGGREAGDLPNPPAKVRGRLAGGGFKPQPCSGNGERTRPRVRFSAPSRKTAGASATHPSVTAASHGSDRRRRQSEHARARVLPQMNCIDTAKPRIARISRMGRGKCNTGPSHRRCGL